MKYFPQAWNAYGKHDIIFSKAFFFPVKLQKNSFKHLEPKLYEGTS